MMETEAPRDDAVDAARYRCLRAHMRAERLESDGTCWWNLPAFILRYKTRTVDEAVDQQMVMDLRTQYAVSAREEEA